MYVRHGVINEWQCFPRCPRPITRVAFPCPDMTRTPKECHASETSSDLAKSTFSGSISPRTLQAMVLSHQGIIYIPRLF